MIQSVNSMSVQTENPWRKIPTVTEITQQVEASQTDAQADTQTDVQTEQSTNSRHGRRGMLMEDLLAIMQSSQRPASVTPTTTTQAEALVTEEDVTATDTTAAAISSLTAAANATASATTQQAAVAAQTNTDSDLSSIDADGDGTISSDEYNALLSKLEIEDAPTADEFFTRFDTNSDGEISMDELNPTDMPKKPPMGPPPEELDAYPDDIDSDGDSTISADEYDKLVSQMGVEDALSSEDFFKEYDTNSDGEITADEIIAGLDKATDTVNVQNNSTTAVTETDDETSSQEISAQEFTAYYQNLAAKMVNAYEKNYELMFGTGNTEQEI